MMEVENFTIFIKNSIRFPTFNYTKYDNYDFNYDAADDEDDADDNVDMSACVQRELPYNHH